MSEQCRFLMGKGDKYRYICKLRLDVCPFQRWCTVKKHFEITDMENCSQFQKKEEKKEEK
nr:MAG TPA: hypothetical protein [Bacteriophage sp.]